MEEEAPRYKEELLRLVAEKKIKHTVKYIENATDETLKKIYEDYQRQELDEVNDQVTDVLIRKISGLMASLKWVKDDVSLEQDLSGNELFKKDVKKIVGYLKPYIPMAGLISGGITLATHVAVKKANP